MRASLRTLWIPIVLLLAASARAAAPDDPLAGMAQMERVLEEMAGRVQPAVVNIRRFVKDDAWWAVARSGGELPKGWRVVSDADLLYPGHRPDEGASGFLVSGDGYLLTLRRVVVDPATQVEAGIVDVEVGADHYRAEIVSLEPTLDLAILKIAPPRPVPHLKLGDSNPVRSGHWAIAFGDPAGREKTMVPGFVAFQPTRDCYQDELSATYLQTSMVVCDGALGGPLVDLRGNVIGVITRRRDSPAAAEPAAGAGSGYALPVNLATAIYTSLLERKSKDSPWLGISVLLLSDTLRQRLGDPNLSGIYIDNVFDPSPAAQAGIRIGDVLQQMDGQAITNVYEFQRRLYQLGAGTRVKLGLVRNRKLLQIVTAIARRPTEATTR